MRGVPTTLTEAQALFLTWLLDGGPDREDGPRSVSDAHPELEGALRALWTRYRRIQALEEGSVDDGNEGTVVELLKTSPGSDTTAGGEGAGETTPPGVPIHLGNYTFAGETIEGDPVRIAVVRDENLGRELVMKVHRERVGESTGESLRRFLREAALLGELDHPGVPPIHEVGIDRSGRAFFTTPLREGESLRRGLEALRAKHPGWMVARGVRVLVAVNDTLRFAHSRGIVHGALTADDVFVGEFGEVLITGWGSAFSEREPDVEALELRVHASLSLDELFGVDSAISPEAREDAATASTPRPVLSDPDPAIDLRAVGELVDDLLRAAYPGGRGRPAELVAIADAARGADPWHTYQGVEPLAEDLRAFLEQRVVRAHRTGALAELRQWSRRNRGVVAVVVVALLVVVGLLVRYALDEARRGDQILELADLQEVELLRRAADELWLEPSDRATEEWGRVANDWRRVADHLVERVERKRREQGPPATLDRVQAFNRNFAARAEGFLSGERVRLLGVKTYQRWIDELRRLEPRVVDGTAGPAERERREFLIHELGSFEKYVLDALYRGEPTPEERFDPDGAPEEWRLLRLERLFREETDLHRETPGFSPTLHRGPTRGAIRDLEWELELLQRWRAATDDTARDRWRRAYASVLPAEEAGWHSPRYPLLPLHANPSTGCWEFWDLRSGAAPVVLPDGGLQIDESTATVYVLVPGRDAAASGPAIPPFFVSKYELTQAQWQRFDLTRSFRWAGFTEGIEFGVTPRHPAEQKPTGAVAWTLRRLGARLPTEWQWEYLAGGRGGLGLVAAGMPEEAAAAANLAGPEDGFVVHAPVGSFPPGPFGLHDLWGNVSEMCLIDEVVESPDAYPVDLDEENTVLRGGAFDDALEDLIESDSRRYVRQASNIGVRPVMELLP